MQIRNIVFPVDFSERSRAAAPFIISMARRYYATVTLMHVIPPLPPLYFDFGMTYPDASDTSPGTAAVEEHLREFAADYLPRVKTRCVASYGDPASGIVEVSRQVPADLITLPTHGYGIFRRALLGSVTAKVLHDSTIPVWTSAHACDPAHRAHPLPRVILAAIDLKDETEHTLHTALSLARDSGACVEILHIASEGCVSAAAPERKLEFAMARAAAASSLEVENLHTDETYSPRGDKVEEVVKKMALRKRADLVVIGRGGVKGHLLERLESHAYRVICESPCPVLSI